MAKADSQHITIPLSALIRDPRVRAAFERAERDRGQAPLPAPAEPRMPLLLIGGARQSLKTELELHLDIAETLIAALDRIDGDPDLEPYLAGGYGGPLGAPDDREQDANDEGEAGADDDLEAEFIGEGAL